MKRFTALAQDAWMKNNPGRSMTIYDIPEIAAKALPLAATPTNICSGVRVAGVFPFDREIFQEDEYAPSYTTDRPIQQRCRAQQSLTPVTRLPMAMY